MQVSYYLNQYMKKAIAIILGVFVFTLSVSDVLIEQWGHSNSTAVESCESSADGEDHCPQGCSPFHTCCTCPGFTVEANYFVSEFIPALKATFFILYISPLTNSFVGDIFQPPKL
jgi:hypothetical protein